jgi:hypothetical protein
MNNKTIKKIGSKDIPNKMLQWSMFSMGLCPKAELG